MEKIVDCQKHGLGCWYQMMCERSCICEEWKREFCGGRTKEVPCPERRRRSRRRCWSPRSRRSKRRSEDKATTPEDEEEHEPCRDRNDDDGRDGDGNGAVALQDTNTSEQFEHGSSQ